MEFGVIKKPTGPIQLDDWKCVIAAHAALESVPPTTGISPFTEKPTVFHAPDGAALYVEDGRNVGHLSIEDGEIKVTSVPIAVCEEIAALLSAELHEGID